MPDDKNLNTVQQYVGDMVALESHIEEGSTANSRMSRTTRRRTRWCSDSTPW
jgi:hypothetical protein